MYDGNSCFKKKKRNGLFGVGGGYICDFSRAIQICSLLFCTCFEAEQYPLFIKEIFISHLPLASHLSPLRKKKTSQEGSVCSVAAIVFSRMDRYTNTPSVGQGHQGERVTSWMEGSRACKRRNSGQKLSQACLRVCKFTGKDGYSLISIPPPFLFSTPYGLSGRGL